MRVAFPPRLAALLLINILYPALLAQGYLIETGSWACPRVNTIYSLKNLVILPLLRMRNPFRSIITMSDGEFMIFAVKILIEIFIIFFVVAFIFRYWTGINAMK